MRDERVHWAEQQIARIRNKRDIISSQSLWLKYLRSKPPDDPQERGMKYPFPHNDHSFNDELWSRQWYLHDTSNIPIFAKMDLGVKEVSKYNRIHTSLSLNKS